MDQLVEISLDQLYHLGNLYKTDWPRNILGHNTLQNYIFWLEQCGGSTSDFRAYCLNGDLSDGTFVIVNFSIIYGDTINNNKTRLIQLLCLLDLDENEHYRYFYNDHITSAVNDFIHRKRLKTGRKWRFLFYYLSPTDGANIVVPKLSQEFKTRPLSKKDLTEINNSWPYSYPKSMQRLQQLHKFNVSMGVYADTGELVAWILRYEYGGLAMLEVKERFRKRGIAGYIVRAVSKEITKSGEYLSTGILPENHASIRLFESVGYQSSGYLNYIEIVPRHDDT